MTVSTSDPADARSAAPLLCLSGVGKYFGDHQALADIDLEVAKGEVVMT